MMHRLRLAVECLILFVGLPALMMFTSERFLVFGLLWGASFLGGYWLWKHDRAALFRKPRALEIKVMLGQFALFGILLAAMAWITLPGRFLSLPLDRPQLFGMICLLYPFLSALPQEVLYRAFFFSRYRSLMPSPVVQTLLSAVSFSLAHLIFGNWQALALSFLGGALFAWRYAHSRSLTLAIVEHSLYGLLVFAVGLGWYFYLGAGHSFGG